MSLTKTPSLQIVSSTLDSTVIGGVSAAAGVFTTIAVSGTSSLGSTTASFLTVGSLTATTVNGTTVNATDLSVSGPSALAAVTAAAVTATSIGCPNITGNASFGTLAVSGTASLGNVTASNLVGSVNVGNPGSFTVTAANFYGTLTGDVVSPLVSATVANIGTINYSNLLFNGPFTNTYHFQPGAGSSPTGSYSIGEQGGSISMGAGSSPVADTTIITIDLNNPLPGCRVLLMATNANAAVLTPNIWISKAVSGSNVISWSIQISGAALTAGQTYDWDFFISK